MKHMVPGPVRISLADDGTPHLWGVPVDLGSGRTAYCFIGRASLMAHEPEIMSWSGPQMEARVQEIICAELALRPSLSDAEQDRVEFF